MLTFNNHTFPRRLHVLTTYCEFFHVVHLDSNAEHTAVDQVHLYLAPPTMTVTLEFSFLQLSVIRCWHIVNIYKQLGWIDGTWTRGQDMQSIQLEHRAL